MQIHAAPEIGLIGVFKRCLVFTAFAAIGLAAAACGSPAHGTGKTSASSHASPSGPAASGAPTSGTSPKSGSAGSLAVCQTSQLKIAIGRTGAAAGMSGGDLQFTNTGSTACQLVGWPALVGVTSGGSSQAAVRVHSTEFGPFNGGQVNALSLSPGATAAVAFIVGANNCSDTYKTLTVTPPGNTQSVDLSAWLPVVQTYLPACAPISVSPLVMASQLPDPMAQP